MGCNIAFDGLCVELPILGASSFDGFGNHMYGWKPNWSESLQLWEIWMGKAWKIIYLRCGWSLVVMGGYLEFGSKGVEFWETTVSCCFSTASRRVSRKLTVNVVQLAFIEPRKWLKCTSVALQLAVGHPMASSIAWHSSFTVYHERFHGRLWSPCSKMCGSYTFWTLHLVWDPSTYLIA